APDARVEAQSPAHRQTLVSSPLTLAAPADPGRWVGICRPTGIITDAPAPLGGVRRGAALALLPATYARGRARGTLRIETASGAQTATLGLIGRMESENLDELRAQVRGHRPQLVVDLDEVGRPPFIGDGNAGFAARILSHLGNHSGGHGIWRPRGTRRQPRPCHRPRPGAADQERAGDPK